MERLNSFCFIKLRRPKRPQGVSWKYWRKNKNRRKFIEINLNTKNRKNKNYPVENSLVSISTGG